MAPLMPLFCHGFESNGRSLDLHALSPACKESSDSPLVLHLLTSWRAARQPNCSNSHTCKQALVGLESAVRKEFGQNVDNVVFNILISYAANIF